MSTRKCGCVYADSRNTPAVRAGHELGGYLKEACDKHKKHEIVEKGMSNHNDGGPAFPIPTSESTHEWNPCQFGMSLRDYFAAKAMAAWISGPASECMDDYDENDLAFKQHQRAVADAAYGYADAMLAAREGK